MSLGTLLDLDGEQREDRRTITSLDANHESVSSTPAAKKSSGWSSPANRDASHDAGLFSYFADGVNDGNALKTRAPRTRSVAADEIDPAVAHGGEEYDGDGPVPKEIHARITEVSITSQGMTRLIMNRGAGDGVREGARGRIPRSGGVNLARFQVTSVMDSECSALVDASIDELQGHIDVVIVS